jgi:hypothetical protein
MGSLLIDQQLNPDTLLTRRFTIHGAEVGIKPNDIFTSFLPLGSTLARYAESFGLFDARRKANSTMIIPLLKTPPSISDVVVDPEAFQEEAKTLGTLEFVQKNILATHRNMKMTEEAHYSVSRLFLNYSKKLLCALAYGQFIELEVAVNRMNECADEIWRKSSYYPKQATIVKRELIVSDDAVKRFLGKQIEPHEEFTRTEPISKVIMRGSHLVRSLLYRVGAYKPPSNAVSYEQKEFVNYCRNANIDPPREREINNVKPLVRFLNNIILQRFIWWGDSYGKRDD